MIRIYLIIFILLGTSLYGSLLEDVQLEWNNFQTNGSIQKKISETLDITKSLYNSFDQEQIYYELFRMLSYVKDIPHLSSPEYLEKQMSLILVAAKTLKQAEQFSLADYPSDTKRDYIRFIHDIEEGKEHLIAVFKSDSSRIHEILTWEIGAIFGLEEVFTPAMPLILDGKEGELQLYERSDLSKEQSYYHSLYGYVRFDSYIKCSLGVLLLALGDMHSENCYYQFCKEGYLKVGFFDTLSSLTQTKFIPNNKHPDFPSMRAPFNWIGWDYPQKKRKILKKFQQMMLELIESWPERILSYRKYWNHPLTPYSLSDTHKNGVEERAQILISLCLENQEGPVSIWHEAFVPYYPKIEKKTHELIPQYQTAWILFHMHWCPHIVYDWIPEKRHKEFKKWIKRVLKNR